MLLASKATSIKLNFRLWGCTRSFPCSGLPSSLSSKFLRGHLWNNKNKKQKPNKHQYLSKNYFQRRVSHWVFSILPSPFILFHYLVFLLFPLFFPFYFISFIYYFRLKSTLCTFTPKNINSTQKSNETQIQLNAPISQENRGFQPKAHKNNFLHKKS